MNYKSKRFKSGLSTYTLAKELGVSWKQYKDVENKKINLEGELLDKFLDTIKNAKMIKFNRKQKLMDIRTFIREGKLKDLMAKRNHNGFTLARELDITPQDVTDVLNMKHTSDDMIEYVYDFLNNPLNKNLEEKDESKRYEQNDESEISYKELQRLKNEKGFTTQDISNGTGMPASTISHIIGGRKAKPWNLEKIYNFLVNNEKNKEAKNELEQILIEKKISKADVAKALGINYSYVYNYLKGMNIKEEYQTLIYDYITNIGGKKVRRNDPFELDLKEINAMIKEKEIAYIDIAKALGISFSYIEKLLNDRVIGCYDMKRKLDEYIRSFDLEKELTENSEVVQEDEKIIPEETLDELVSEEDIQPIIKDICIEEEVDDDDEDLVDEVEIEDYIADGVISKDYIDLLRENTQLKEDLFQAKKYLRLFEILIERIK